MNETPAPELFALIEGSEPVKIGNIVKRPGLNEQTPVSIEQCKNTIMTTVNMTPEAARRIHELCKVTDAANRMAAKLREMQGMWHAKIKYMPRADRRAYRRAFIQELKRFKAFCAANDITYTIQ